MATDAVEALEKTEKDNEAQTKIIKEKKESVKVADANVISTAEAVNLSIENKNKIDKESATAKEKFKELIDA